jgi:hypothetical protein
MAEAEAKKFRNFIFGRGDGDDIKGEYEMRRRRRRRKNIKKESPSSKELPGIENAKKKFHSSFVLFFFISF